MTALTFYLTNINSTTFIDNANQIAENALGGAEVTHATNCGTSTGWGEIISKGAGPTTWPALSSIGGYTGQGWVDDNSTLDNSQIAQGNWTVTRKMFSTGGITIVADVVVRGWRISSAGVANLIFTATNAATSITNAGVTFTLPAVLVAPITFNAGDKYAESVWCNITTPGGVGATLKITSDTTAGVGVTTAQTVTPGYSAVTPPPIIPPSRSNVNKLSNPFGVTVGLNTGNNDTVYPYFSNLIANYRDLNLSHIRFQKSIKNINQVQGDDPSIWSWVAADNFVQTCNANNIPVVFVLREPGAWAVNQLASSLPWYMNDPAWMAYYAQVFATRYDGNHSHGFVSGWEIGNEEYNIKNVPPGETGANDTFTLNAAITSGVPITTITVNAAVATPLAGTFLYLGGNNSPDECVVTSAVTAGNTTINIGAISGGAFTPTQSYVVNNSVAISYIGYNNSPYTMYNGINGSTPSTKRQMARDPVYATQALIQGYPVIKQYAPTGTPVGMMAAWWNTSGHSYPEPSNYHEFMSGIYAGGAAPYLDYLNFHYYPNIAGPYGANASVVSIAQAVADVIAVANANNDNVNFRITEMGFQVPQDATTYAIQQQWYQSIFDTALNSGRCEAIDFFTLNYLIANNGSSLVTTTDGVNYVKTPTYNWLKGYIAAWVAANQVAGGGSGGGVQPQPSTPTGLGVYLPNQAAVNKKRGLVR